jgi:hypothetical protein
MVTPTQVRSIHRKLNVWDHLEKHSEGFLSLHPRKWRADA